MQAITKSHGMTVVRKLAWFTAYWLASVATVGIVAEIIRWILIPATKGH